MLRAFRSVSTVLFLLLLTGALLLGITPGSALAGPGDLWVLGADSPVTSDPYYQQQPDIDGSMALWTDCGSGGGCYIMVKDLDSSAPAEQLAPMRKGQDNAHMDGGVAVWEQLVNAASGGITFQVYHLRPGSTQPLPLSPGRGRQGNPAISRGRVVWEDQRAGSKQTDIYMYDLETGVESPVCTESSRQQQPDIAGDWVIWVDNRGGSYNYGRATRNDIYAKNIATGEERRITTDADETIQGNPAIGRDELTGDYFAVFEGDGIWLYDFQTSETTKIAMNGSHADMDGHIAVWISRETGRVMMHDVSTGVQQPVSSGDGSVFNPAVSGHRIVWGDDRSGSRDIYENRLLDNAWTLAERYKPLLHFDHDIYDASRRDYEPRTVELMTGVRGARLVADGSVINEPTPGDLASHNSADNYLDLPGSPASPFNDYADEYISLLAGSPNSYPVTVYGRVIPGGAGQEETIIQYWLLYYFNDWFNKHEGDWEMVQVMLDRELQPLAVSYSQHGDALTKDWDEPGLARDGTHPRAFVARGSHANYFREGDDLRAANLWGRVDHTGSITSHFPDLEMDWSASPGGWVGFAGLWGEDAQWWWPPFTVNEGPRGPAFQGWSWDDPLGWALASDWEDGLDSVVISVSAGADLQVHDRHGNRVGLGADGTVETGIAQSEYYRKKSDGSTNIVIHGADVADGLVATLTHWGTGPVDIRVQAPDRAGGIVYRQEYLAMAADAGSKARLDLASAAAMFLSLDNDSDGIADENLAADISQPVPVDFAPPGAVNDLRISSIAPDSAGLAWSAPGDDGDLGTASAYEVRYAKEPLTEINWSSAREAGSALQPQAAGSSEELLVQDLDAGTRYYLGVRARDDAWQLGPLAQVVEVTTTQPDLFWSMQASYWSSLADYQNNRLTVEYDLASIGSATARDLQVWNSLCSPSIVMLTTPMPLKAGDLPPGESRQVSMTYVVPEGIKAFKTTSYVLCRDDSGGEHWFPGAPSGETSGLA